MYRSIASFFKANEVKSPSQEDLKKLDEMKQKVQESLVDLRTYYSDISSSVSGPLSEPHSEAIEKALRPPSSPEFALYTEKVTTIKSLDQVRNVCLAADNVTEVCYDAFKDLGAYELSAEESTVQALTPRAPRVTSIARYHKVQPLLTCPKERSYEGTTALSQVYQSECAAEKHCLNELRFNPFHVWAKKMQEFFGLIAHDQMKQEASSDPTQKSLSTLSTELRNVSVVTDDFSDRSEILHSPKLSIFPSQPQKEPLSAPCDVPHELENGTCYLQDKPKLDVSQNPHRQALAHAVEPQEDLFTWIGKKIRKGVEYLIKEHNRIREERLAREANSRRLNATKLDEDLVFPILNGSNFSETECRPDELHPLKEIPGEICLAPRDDHPQISADQDQGFDLVKIEVITKKQEVTGKGETSIWKLISDVGRNILEKFKSRDQRALPSQEELEKLEEMKQKVQESLVDLSSFKSSHSSEKPLAIVSTVGSITQVRNVCVVTDQFSDVCDLSSGDLGNPEVSSLQGQLQTHQSRTPSEVQHKIENSTCYLQDKPELDVSQNPHRQALAHAVEPQEDLFTWIGKKIRKGVEYLIKEHNRIRQERLAREANSRRLNATKLDEDLVFPILNGSNFSETECRPDELHSVKEIPEEICLEPQDDQPETSISSLALKEPLKETTAMRPFYQSLRSISSKIAVYVNKLTMGFVPHLGNDQKPRIKNALQESSKSEGVCLSTLAEIGVQEGETALVLSRSIPDQGVCPTDFVPFSKIINIDHLLKKTDTAVQEVIYLAACTPDQSIQQQAKHAVSIYSSSDALTAPYKWFSSFRFQTPLSKMIPSWLCKPLEVHNSDSSTTAVGFYSPKSLVGEQSPTLPQSPLADNGGLILRPAHESIRVSLTNTCSALVAQGAAIADSAKEWMSAQAESILSFTKGNDQTCKAFYSKEVAKVDSSKDAIAQTSIAFSDPSEGHSALFWLGVVSIIASIGYFGFKEVSKWHERKQQLAKEKRVRAVEKFRQTVKLVSYNIKIQKEIAKIFRKGADKRKPVTIYPQLFLSAAALRG